MITKDEIEAKAAEFDIHAANVERDYVFGWLLTGIYSVSALKDTLVLKGGNCFRKGYFAMTRFSGDLDFSCQTAIDQGALLGELNKVCDFVQDQAGIVFEKERNRAEEKQIIDRDKKVYEARLYFKDFYGNPDTITISVRLDVTQFDRLYLPVQTRKLIHPYSDSGVCNSEIRCVKLEELLATKLKCLLQRRHLADLYDYVHAIFINKELEVNKREIVTTFFRKTIFERSPRVVSGLLIGLPLHAFKEMWTKYLVCPKPSLIGFESALDNFVQNVKELFGEVIPQYGRSIFFPAELRNPIIDAGSSMTLLAVTYDGVRRMVEPYSLSYKQRKDGHAEEYFFCYDRTGGRSSPPGLKTFVSSKIQRLESLEEKFEPRFPVELSKSGEYGEKIHFGSSSSSGRTSGTARHRRTLPSGRIYIVQCSYCGKKFRRKTSSTRLNQHKDSYGNKCYGRSGFRVF
jgi:predicted nucleotidyltransferase component of viral defense system